MWGWLVPYEDDYVPCVNDYVPYVDDYVPCVDDYVPCVDDYVPRVDDYVPRVDDYEVFLLSICDHSFYDCEVFFVNNKWWCVEDCELVLPSTNYVNLFAINQWLCVFSYELTGGCVYRMSRLVVVFVEWADWVLCL